MTGNCFEANGSWVLQRLHDGTTRSVAVVLVHAIVDGQGPLEGRRIGHCWIEMDDVIALDLSNGRTILTTIQAYRAAARKITGERRYTPGEAAMLATGTEHWGPWEEEL